MMKKNDCTQKCIVGIEIIVKLIKYKYDERPDRPAAATTVKNVNGKNFIIDKYEPSN